MSCWLTLLRQLTSSITSYQLTETSLHSNFSTGQLTHPEFSPCLFALTDKAASDGQQEATNDLSTGALIWWSTWSLASVGDILGQMGQWHSAKVFAFVTPYMHPLSGQLSEHSSSSHHCSCCLCRDPGLDASAPCWCLDAAAVLGHWRLVRAKVFPQAPLTAVKGPLKQPQDQGRANPLEQQLCHYPWPRHAEENLARVWWNFPGCVLCEDPEPLIFMLKSLQGNNL